MNLRSRIRRLVAGANFQKAVSLMIILCSVVMGLATMYKEEAVLFRIIDDFFLVFFAVEIILRLIAEERLLDFFKVIEFKRGLAIDGPVHQVNHSAFSDPGKSVPGQFQGGDESSPRISRLSGSDYGHQTRPRLSINFREKAFWNCFDFTIMVISSISLFAYIFPHPEFLIVSRLFRGLRLLRLLDVSESLKSVERKIVSIIPAIFSFALLLAILLYIYSIIGIYIFGQVDLGRADFTSISSAFMSLFQVMTLDGWSDIMTEAAIGMEKSGGSVYLAKAYFISFVVLTAIVSFNVFVAVLTSQVYDQLNNSKVQEKSADIRLISEELRKIRIELEQLRGGKKDEN